MSNIFSYAAVGALILLLIIILPCIVRILQQRISGCFKELKKGEMLGASVRNFAHGKGHEEGGFGIRKGRIEPQETPCSRASTPKTRVPTLLFYALTYTSDFMGGCSPTTSLGEGVNLQLQLIKIPGHDKNVSTYKLC